MPRAVTAESWTAGLNAFLLAARFGIGLAISAHGAQQLFGWFGGAGLSETARHFTSIGYPNGNRMAIIAGLGEIVGGLGLAVGVLTLPAAFLAAAILLYTAAIDGGFFTPEGVKYEPLLAVCAVVLGLYGPGRYALGRYIPAIRTYQFSYTQRAVLMTVGLVGVMLAIRR
ncbi:DoxX family protein [Nocardia sp. NPDC052566]|uniref:DoxX family protein n=1 Tax=Nocardia sp. NPDC052566 TaxID=3364330 RepID=UPI0037C67F05